MRCKREAGSPGAGICVTEWLRKQGIQSTQYLATAKMHASRGASREGEAAGRISRDAHKGPNGAPLMGRVVLARMSRTPSCCRANGAADAPQCRTPESPKRSRGTQALP